MNTDRYIVEQVIPYLNEYQGLRRDWIRDIERLEGDHPNATMSHYRLAQYTYTVAAVDRLRATLLAAPKLSTLLHFCLDYPNLAPSWEEGLLEVLLIQALRVAEKQEGAEG